MVKRKFPETNTYRISAVDKFQGMERDIVIVSTVRSNNSKSIGFARESERINVAFSRAKKLLIVIGSEKIVDFMIKNVDSKKRNTGLEYKMEQ